MLRIVKPVSVRTADQTSFPRLNNIRCKALTGSSSTRRRRSGWPSSKAEEEAAKQLAQQQADGG